ncbi:Fpg/Nei family DNA glycosylase [Nocardioides sp. SYSU D00065]|uniref:Fpg/Nei family DNA glycosylase n=1 Tax=Nocardioides sp. SYSU D00065 TaxID=2817378 RepID=UPI001B338472|nr:Fpg/Nei family DNA glycosylase [Nocardioides sp. SYSU D00065]
MPEGDTVYRAAARLDGALSGQRLTLTDFRVPAFATVDLSGGTVVRSFSRGKHILTRIEHEQAWTLHTHLKMEGSWHVYRERERWRRPDVQVRIVLGVAGRRAVGFQLGVVELVPRQAEAELVAHLGPDLLGPDWDEERALANLRAQPQRPIGQALLDQRNLAGIGNMYMAELCFIMGVHPATAVADVAQLARLVRRGKQMLEVNKERAVQSTTGNLRERERMWVYRRDRSPCRRCGTPIAVTMLGEAGRERAAYWCPSCQPV